MFLLQSFKNTMSNLIILNFNYITNKNTKKLKATGDLLAK